MSEDQWDVGDIWNPTATRRLLHDLANDPVVVAGQEARWYVRAAMTPGINEDVLHEWVRLIAVPTLIDGLSQYATAETRATIAAAAIRGYVEREVSAA